MLAIFDIVILIILLSLHLMGFPELFTLAKCSYFVNKKRLAL